MNAHTCKLFKNIHNDIQSNGHGEINTAWHNFSQKCILILYKLKDLKSKFLKILQHFLCFTIKECAIDVSNDIYDSSCLISMHTHNLRMQIAVTPFGCG